MAAAKRTRRKRVTPPPQPKLGSPEASKRMREALEHFFSS